MPRSVGGKAALGLGVAAAGFGMYRALRPSQPKQAQYKLGSQLETNETPRASGQFDTDHIDPRPPESRAWNRRHQHGFAPEQGEYALRKAFDGVTTNPMHEVIESADGPSDIPDMT